MRELCRIVEGQFDSVQWWKRETEEEEENLIACSLSEKTIIDKASAESQMVANTGLTSSEAHQTRADRLHL